MRLFPPQAGVNALKGHLPPGRLGEVSHDRGYPAGSGRKPLRPRNSQWNNLYWYCW